MPFLLIVFAFFNKNIYDIIHTGKKFFYGPPNFVSESDEIIDASCLKTLKIKDIKSEKFLFVCLEVFKSYDKI